MRQPQKLDESGFLRVRHDRIVPFAEQPRKYFSEASIQELAASIKTEGQNTPVQLCKTNGGKGSTELRDADGNALFSLIDGERRWRACSLIAKETGKPFLMKATIEIVRDLKEQFRRSFGANFQHEDMTELEIAAGFQRLRDDGATLDLLAQSYGKSMKYITDYLSLNDLHSEVRALMNPELPKDRRLRVTHAVQIARVRDQSKQIKLAQEVVSYNLSVLDLRMSIENAGLHRLDHTPNGTGYYTPRTRRVSDDRAILTNLLRSTDMGLKRFVTRIKRGDVDMEDLYLSCQNGEEVFEQYGEILTSIGESVVALNQSITDALEK